VRRRQVVLCWGSEDPEPPIADEIPLYLQTHEGVCHYTLSFDASCAIGGDARAHFVAIYEW
jgi:hypothetical protein